MLASIDGSTRKTGMALFDDAGKYIDSILIDLSSDKASTDERITTMGKRIHGQLTSWRPDVVYIEEPKGHSNIDLVRKLSEILGIVRAWCFEHAAEYHEIKPSVWRARLDFKQGATKREELKQESIDYVSCVYNRKVSDDEADAICIGVAATKEKK